MRSLDRKKYKLFMESWDLSGQDLIGRRDHQLLKTEFEELRLARRKVYLRTGFSFGEQRAYRITRFRGGE